MGERPEPGGLPPDARTLALVADVQVADRDDRGDTRYRGALARLERALDDARAAGCDGVVQLGDVVDGYLDGPRDRTDDARADLEDVLEAFARAGLPWTSVPGNHGLAVGRAHLLRRLGLVAPDATDAAADDAPVWRRVERAGVRLLLLDTVFVQPVGRPAAHPRVREARAWLARQDALARPEATDWNGALGEAQRRWLADEFAAAREAGAPVLVLAHHPLLTEASDPRFPAWDAAETLAVCDRIPGPLGAWVAGHFHRGGRARRNGVEHACLRGLVRATEAERDGPAPWARLDLGLDGPGTWRLSGPGWPGEPTRGGPPGPDR